MIYGDFKGKKLPQLAVGCMRRFLEKYGENMEFCPQNIKISKIMKDFVGKLEV